MFGCVCFGGGTNLGIGLGEYETTLTTLTLRPSLGLLRYFPVQSFIGPVAEGREGVCAGNSTLKSQRRRTLWRTNGGRISPAIVSLQYPSQNPLPCLSALLRIPLNFALGMQASVFLQLKPTQTRLSDLMDIRGLVSRH